MVVVVAVLYAVFCTLYSILGISSTCNGMFNGAAVSRSRAPRSCESRVGSIL